ncbi:hypothetical protein HZB94_01780 [Candidatus Falkowbacteria bacterium]|nr:hypothetical protein [Candidatus Falkowbacteria bacterium]
MPEKHYEGAPWEAEKERIRKEIGDVGESVRGHFEGNVHHVVFTSPAIESIEDRQEILPIVEDQINVAIQQLEEVRKKYREWAQGK